jgi:hypothetical protein
MKSVLRREEVELLNQLCLGKHAAACIQQCLCNWPRQLRLAAGIVWRGYVRNDPLLVQQVRGRIRAVRQSSAAQAR